MKRVVSIFIFFLSVVVAMAQELSVKSFTLDLTDLSASTESRTSINGDLCALVKVYLAVSDATFQGNIVGDVVHNVNQYWVYMPSGSKKLQINHPNYLPLDVSFADYGINRLESKQTYVLVVNLPEQVPSQPADTGGSFVSLVVKPENAVVSIDGKSLSVEATGQYMSMLSYGQHSYQVECGGYVTKSGTFDIKRGSTTELNVSLVSALATLTISCPTAGASLYIDKKSVGSLPWTGTLQEGMHLIEAKKEGHRDVQKSVTLAQQQKLAVALDALTPIVGNLSVAYRPIGADIYIDGKKSGTSPYVFNGILVGSHKVEIRKDGYASETKSVTIKEGETATLQGNLNALASASSSSSSSSSSATVSNGSHEYVDLGLSVKWATCNVGASKPEGYGDYFAWGETKPKKTYNWSTYKYCKGSYKTMTRYCTSSSKGTVDNKTVLAPEDDAAHVNWGGTWRLPTRAEQDELRKKCTWTWTTLNGVKGYKVTSKKNGKSLFLPAASYRYDSSPYRVGSDGYYWSSSLYSDNSGYACYLYFYSGNVDWSLNNRNYGLSVRAVCP